MTDDAKDRLQMVVATFVEMFDPDAPPRLFGMWRQTLTQVVQPTPVGERCFLCLVPIREGDTGEFMMTREAQHQIPFHIECLILLFMGHELRVCAHHGYGGCVNLDGSPNLRSAALLAADRLDVGKAVLPWKHRRGAPS